MSRFGNCESKQGEKYNGVFSVSKKRKWKGKNYTLAIRSHKSRTRKEFKHNEMRKSKLRMEVQLRERTLVRRVFQKNGWIC